MDFMGFKDFMGIMGELGVRFIKKKPSSSTQ